MNHTLATPELLREIFENLLDPFCELRADGSKIGKGTVYSAALTCRQWTEPALDVLWSGQTVKVNDTYLLRTLGTLTTDVPHEYSEGMPIPETWDRFTRYSRRVVTLDLQMDGMHASPMVYSIFAAARPVVADLFPRMRSIDVVFDPNGFFSPAFIIPWIGAGLREFWCRYNSDNQASRSLGWAPFSSYLRKHAPHLNSLSLGRSRDHTENAWSPKDILAFLDFQNLTYMEVVIHYISAEFLSVVSKMNNLEDLIIRSAFAEPLEMPTVHLNTMTSLVYLALRSCPIHFVTHILALSAGWFSVITFHYSGGAEDVDAGDILTFCSSIISAFPSLSDLELDFNLDDEPSPRLDIEEFLPLSHITTLDSLYIGGTTLRRDDLDRLESLLKKALKATEFIIV